MQRNLAHLYSTDKVVPPRSATEAAQQVGISPHQHKTVVHVANVPQ